MAKTEAHEARDLAEAIRIIEDVMIAWGELQARYDKAVGQVEALLSHIERLNRDIAERDRTIAGMRQQMKIRD